MSAKQAKLETTDKHKPKASAASRTGSGAKAQPAPADQPPRSGDSKPKDTVRLRRWGAESRLMRFLAWKNNRREFFVEDEARHPLVVTPHLPFPKGNGWEFSGEPFPEADPVSIEPFRLIPPPCCAIVEEAEALRQFSRSDERRGCDALETLQSRFISFAWRLFPELRAVHAPPLWWIQYGEALAARPEDDTALQERLAAALICWEKEREAREREIKSITEADVQRHLHGENSARRVTEEEVAKFIEDQRTALFHSHTRPCLMGPDGESGIGGCLHTTLADVKRHNAGGIRDSYLHEQWAKEHGFDLAVMERERAAFLLWTRRHVTNATASVFNAVTRERYYQRDLRLGHDREMALLALVAYKMRFANRDPVYLYDFELRDKLTADEARELAEIVRLSSRVPPAANIHESLSTPLAGYYICDDYPGRKEPIGPHFMKRKDLRLALGYGALPKEGAQFRKLVESATKWFLVLKGKRQRQAHYDIREWKRDWRPGK